MYIHSGSVPPPPDASIKILGARLIYMTVQVISKIIWNESASPIHTDSRNQLHNRTVTTEIFMDMLLNVLQNYLMFFIWKNTSCSLSLFLQQRSCLKFCLQSAYCCLRQNWNPGLTDFQTCWATFCPVIFLVHISTTNSRVLHSASS